MASFFINAHLSQKQNVVKNTFHCNILMPLCFSVASHRSPLCSAQLSDALQDSFLKQMFHLQVHSKDITGEPFGPLHSSLPQPLSLSSELRASLAPSTHVHFLGVNGTNGEDEPHIATFLFQSLRVPVLSYPHFQYSLVTSLCINFPYKNNHACLT